MSWHVWTSLHCGDLFCWPMQLASSSEDTLVFNKEKIPEIQEAVETLGDTSTVWMLTSIGSQTLPGPFSFTTVLGRPLFLYILMSQRKRSLLLSLSPFVQCLSCIVELGSWVPMIELGDFRPRDWEVNNGGVVELIMPNGSKLEITCE